MIKDKVKVLGDNETVKLYTVAGMDDLDGVALRRWVSASVRYSASCCSSPWR